MMQCYKRLSGDSGVVAYEAEKHTLRVQFEDGSVYLYDYESSGRKHVESMKKLAFKGKGLTTYINQNVRDRFAAKLQ